jgi:hypothetical protein
MLQSTNSDIMPKDLKKKVDAEEMPAITVLPSLKHLAHL